MAAWLRILWNSDCHVLLPAQNRLCLQALPLRRQGRLFPASSCRRDTARCPLEFEARMAGFCLPNATNRTFVRKCNDRCIF